MQTQALRFIFILLGSLTLSTFSPVSIAPDPRLFGGEPTRWCDRPFGGKAE